MTDSLLIALDFGTSSVRAIAFDTRGRAFKRGGDVVDAQLKYEQTTTGDGGVEVDADRLLALVLRCIKQVLTQLGPDRRRVVGVGISCFWHSLVGVDKDNRAVTTLLSWADTRPAGYVDEVKRCVEGVDYHQRTGCELHPSFWPAKILWLKDTGKADRVRKWMGFGEYVLARLFGSTASSLSMASGTGLFNQSSADWDDEIVTALDIDRSRLPELIDCETPITGATDEYRKALGVLADLPWYPAVGDGACSNIGSGGVDKSRIVLNIGTSAAMRVVVPAGESIESGLFCYRVDKDSALFGGAFANGGNVHAWLKNTFAWTDDEAMAKQVTRIKPDAHGLTILPFWSGERSPGWHGNARAAITGMNLHTTQADIVRAGIEACSYSFDQVRQLLQARFPSAKELIVSGGALAHDGLWAQMLADVFGVPLVTGRVSEASSRGAALLALRSLGILKSLDSAPFAKGRTLTPDMQRHEAYQTACERYRKLYRKMLEE